MDRQTIWSEPAITINGHALTSAQSMTVRVALEGMAMDLTNGGLGDDERSKDIDAEYLARIREIRKMMSL